MGTRRLERPVALTIAGSDSGGGAGIQADLKTFARFGVFGASVVTAATAQNTIGVQAVHAIPPGVVAAQLDAVLCDLGAAACKSGMLGNAETVEVVAAGLRRHGLARYVCDPVMVAKGGARLLLPEAENALKTQLLPLAALVTPNADELEVLTGRCVATRADMEDAARAMADLGSRAVLIKGGHIEVEPGVALDLLFDGRDFEELRAPRLVDAPTHGAGCTLSAAIAAGLALDRPLADAVRAAKHYLLAALEAGGIPGCGDGNGCPDHSVAGWRQAPPALRGVARSNAMVED